MNLTKNFISDLRKEICELFLKTPEQKNLIRCPCGQELYTQPRDINSYLLTCPSCLRNILFSTKRVGKEIVINEYLLPDVPFEEIKALKEEENNKVYEKLTFLLSRILFLSKEDVKYFDVPILMKYINIFLNRYLVDFKENQLNTEVYKFWV